MVTVIYSNNSVNFESEYYYYQVEIIMQNESKEIKANLVTSLLLQASAVLNSFICSKVIIATFGSEINGLTSSIKQFLNCISLLEGGVGAVILASLYSPYYSKNKRKINEIYSASRHFFLQIITIFICYSITIAIVYPNTVSTPLDKKEVSLLIVIISASLIIQYYLFISDKLLLMAANKLYIVNLAMCCAFVLNAVLTYKLAETKNIYVVEIGSCVAFLIQPIIYLVFSRKFFSIKRVHNLEKNILSQRWDGFHQNLAYFINSNTDVIILTFFSLKEVSVYSVYMLVVNGVKAVILAISNSFQAMIGKSLSLDNEDTLNNKFGIYERFIQNISTLMFGTVILIIRGFVLNYIKDVNDVNYNRILFPLIISIAYYIICFREPYNLLINSANHFKRTVKGAVVEAVINVCLSIILVIHYGIIGVAIGTLVASFYRLLYFINYIRGHIIHKEINSDIKRFISYAITILIDCVIYILLCDYIPHTWITYIIISSIELIINAIIILITAYFMDPKKLKEDIIYIKHKIRNH